MIYFIGKHVDYVGVENSTIKYLLDYFNDKVEVGFDTETEGFDVFTDKILAYQFGDKANQFVVDAKLHPIEKVKSLLTDSTKELLVHNFKFDGKFCYHAGIYPPKVWDTYLGECVLYKGDKTIRKSLEATTHRYFNYLLKKYNRDKIFREGFTERVIHYCAEDVEYLPDIREFQYQRMEKQGLLNSMSLENLFVKVLAYIEYSGIYLDAVAWSKKIAQDNISYQNCLNLLNSWILDNNLVSFIENQLDLFSTEKRASINWSSPKQVIDLFEKLGIDTQITDKKTGKLKHSVEAFVVEKQKDKSTIVPIYIDYKKKEKILSTYGENVLTKIHPVTGRIHTSFTQIMNTGRLSSGGEQGGKETINIQNIPRLPEGKERIKGKIYERECFTCEKGNVLIDADYAGQENIVFANWTLDKDILLFYEKDLGDMHSFIAQKIFPNLRDISLKVIKLKYPHERQVAKAAGFAIKKVA
jgi:DNA polymerase-1